jgi:hypothetical protein
MRRALITLAFAVALVTALVGARSRPSRNPAPAPAFGSGPTFSNEVVRILQDHCQSCHHPGDIAPFSLMSYSDARFRAADIKFMTQTHQMPPWKPSASCNALADARVLSQADIDTLAAWVDGGAPEGDRSKLPAPRTFDGGWALNQPDLVLQSPEAYTPPEGKDTYRCFTMPTNLSEDQYVSAIDVRPGDRQTVHHVIAFIDTTGESVALDQNDPGPGYTCFGGPGFSISNPGSATLGGWAPGARPVMLPDGVAMSLPAASRIVLQVHYHPHGTAAVADDTQIGVYYAKVKPNKLLRILPLINNTFTIPPNDANYKVMAGFDIPKIPFFATDAHLWLIAPHMHLLGKKMNIQAKLPSGSTECLINIDDWDFNWQGLYRFQDPVALPAGTSLSLTAYYDNSAGNLKNPNDPPKAVSWGEATTDEMCIGFLGVTLDSENLTTGKTADASWIPGIGK